MNTHADASTVMVVHRYHVIEADNGKTALEHFARETSDAALLDPSMLAMPVHTFLRALIDLQSPSGPTAPRPDGRAL